MSLHYIRCLKPLFEIWWITVAMKFENCNEAKWAALSKYWNTIYFIKKQAIMSVCTTTSEEPIKVGVWWANTTRSPHCKYTYSWNLLDLLLVVL
jgi:hypothetical protein